jgi:hypothetical protein
MADNEEQPHEAGENDGDGDSEGEKRPAPHELLHESLRISCTGDSDTPPAVDALIRTHHSPAAPAK